MDPTTETTTKDTVTMQVTVTPETRRTIRAIAALMGVSVAEVIAAWTVEQAARFGLPRVGDGRVEEGGE